MRNGHSSKTVYFLGAGASNELFGLATMKEFFNNYPVDDYKMLSRFLSQYFFNGLEEDKLENKIKESSLNLEDVITALELSLDRVGSFGKHPESYLIDVRREFDKFVKEKCNLENNNYDKSKAEKIVKSLDPKDTVITLNYDLGLDELFGSPSNHSTRNSRLYCDLLGNAASYMDTGINMAIEEEEFNNLYLKLHGSINWIYCAKEDCYYHNFIQKEDRYFKENLLCRTCGSSLFYVIIPPTLHKSFERFPKLGLLWSLAYRKLNEAVKIIIFGVSFADSDYYLRWLFKSAIAERESSPPRIAVVNKDSCVCNKVKDITGITPDFEGDFDEYIEKIKLREV